MPEQTSAAVKCYVEAGELAATTDWGDLPFFRNGQAGTVAAFIDERVAAGGHVLPLPGEVLSALHMTPPGAVRAVILGQDPYPTPGDAHGLAFSVAGQNRKLPMSLRTIFQTLEQDTGLVPPTHGNLSQWAHNGVLLLNTVLTVEAGQANAHKDAGWQDLAAQVIDRLNARVEPVVFMLWGKQAQAAGRDIDRTRHCVIETAHPSPLARGSGPVHRFVEARPFRQAAEWLRSRGLPQIDWTLPDRPETD